MRPGVRRGCAGVLVAALTLLPTTEARAEPLVERLAGADRYATAVAVASSLHASASTVVLATGTNYPDALAAGTLAAALDAPLLLATAAGVPASTVGALAGYGPDRVILVGGTGALGEEVVRQVDLATDAEVVRLAGANRFETGALVAREAFTTSDRVFLASGESFGDALVASVHAARLGARLLVTGRDAIDPAVAAELERARPVEIVTVRSPGGLADVVTAQAEAFADRVVAVDGDDPTALNVALLDRFPAERDVAVVSIIDSFPDALSAATLSAASDAPTIFVRATSAGVANVELVRALDPVTLLVVGGPAAVPVSVLQQLFGWLAVPPEVAPGAGEAMALDVFARINAERAARGVAPLLWNAWLAADAATWSRHMAGSGLVHAAVAPGDGESIHSTSSYCEDGTCYLPTSGVLHRDLMHSSTNRDSILEPAYVEAGVGVHCAPDGTVWITERFHSTGAPYTGAGSAPSPIVHDDTSGVTCELDRPGDQPWWPPVDS